MQEPVTRWCATVAFLGCAFGLVFVLGAVFAPWVGLAVGTVLSAVVAGPLWSRYLDGPDRLRD